ncbi:hypothetical protein HAX54_034427 [Datura stramonium]|uniref:Uncharacterized protein n=1 Tax=Datura stramonium TaxID=4076 RepID=A0ABS8VGI0_DATST|nr:hypothetical protein [Datura stramonium]
MDEGLSLFELVMAKSKSSKYSDVPFGENTWKCRSLCWSVWKRISSHKKRYLNARAGKNLKNASEHHIWNRRGESQGAILSGSSQYGFDENALLSPAQSPTGKLTLVF